MMPFSPIFVALTNEGHLARGCLATGLTALRNAKHPNKSDFYVGFFQLSVAIERITKLTLIIEHMRQHSFVPPPDTEIRKYGHNLKNIYSQCEVIARSIGVSSFSAPVDNSIESDILIFLTDFSTKTRYHNLDSISGKKPSLPNPLSRWDAILRRVMDDDVPIKKKIKSLGVAKATYQLFAGNFYGIQHGMDDLILNDEEIFLVPAEHDLAAPYAMVRIFNLINSILILIDEVARLAINDNPKKSRDLLHVPYMHEFFTHFRGSPAEIMRKKRWP